MTNYLPGDLLRLEATIRVTHVSRDGVALIGWLPSGDVVSLQLPQPGVTLTPLTSGAQGSAPDRDGSEPWAVPALPVPVVSRDGQGTPLMPEPGRLHPVMPRPMQDPALGQWPLITIDELVRDGFDQPATQDGGQQ